MCDVFVYGLSAFCRPCRRMSRACTLSGVGISSGIREWLVWARQAAQFELCKVTFLDSFSRACENSTDKLIVWTGRKQTSFCPTSKHFGLRDSVQYRLCKVVVSTTTDLCPSREMLEKLFEVRDSTERNVENVDLLSIYLFICPPWIFSGERQIFL